MAAWSRLFLSKGQQVLRNNGLLAKVLPKNETVRCMSEHRTIPIIPSRWQWHKTKDWLHFYFLVGAIPVGITVFCANVFIGPATLEEIPEGYIPERWEYYRSPVTRFLSRYCFPNPQQEYEKYLHYISQANDYCELRALESKVRDMIKEHMDYPAYYYKQSLNAKYIKQTRERLDAADS